jgi:hypothetical protein
MRVESTAAVLRARDADEAPNVRGSRISTHDPTSHMTASPNVGLTILQVYRWVLATDRANYRDDPMGLKVNLAAVRREHVGTL